MMIICHYTPSSSSGALLKLAQTTGLNSINESNRNLQLKDPETHLFLKTMNLTISIKK